MYSMLNLSAQALHFKLQVEHEKNGVAKQLQLIANGENIITDYSGNFTLTVNPSISTVLIQSADEKKYVVRYPKGGLAILPKNADDIIRIIVDDPDKD